MQQHYGIVTAILYNFTSLEQHNPQHLSNIIENCNGITLTSQQHSSNIIKTVKLQYNINVASAHQHQNDQYEDVLTALHCKFHDNI